MDVLHTTTFESVMAPVAQAIAELVLVEEDSRAQNAPLPDLYPVAESVVESTRLMATVASKMLNESDDAQTAETMPNAIAAITSSSDGVR